MIMRLIDGVTETSLSQCSANAEHVTLPCGQEKHTCSLEKVQSSNVESQIAGNVQQR